MKVNSRKPISWASIIVASIVFTWIGFYSTPTTAQVSFIKSLPAGYTAYSSQFNVGKFCSCSIAGISGAPPGPPPCNTSFCFGSSNTRYAWIATREAGIRGRGCDESRTPGRALPPCFQLDGDDAIVISGSISPMENVTYYSFTLYQVLNYNSDFPSNYATLQSSVNLGLNKSNFKKGSNGKYIIIVAANTNTLNVIQQSLRASGVPDAIVNTYLFPASIATATSLDYPDQLAFTLRITPQGETEKQQVNTFLQQTIPATKVIFIKGPGTTGDITFDQLPEWNDTLRANTVEYATGLDRNLKELEATITRRFSRQGYSLKVRLPEKLLHVDANACRTDVTGCVFDSPDALYSSFPCDFAPTLRNANCEIDLKPNNQDVLMLIGVDHTLAGDKTLASYFSVESQRTTGSQDGTFSYLGLYTRGSAKQYLSGGKAANLYAVKITRNCGNESACVAIPYEGDTLKRSGFFIVGRTYLDKVTASAPNPANLVPAVLLWFTKS